MELLFGIVFSLVIAGLSLWAISNRTSHPITPALSAPRFTFADSDLSETLDELLKRPGVISMSAKPGQELAVKVNPYRTDAGESYTTTGPATIIIVPEDGNE